MNSLPRLRVAFVSYLLAHYQLPLSTLMARSARVEFSFFADSGAPSHLSSLRLLDPRLISQEGATFHRLKSLWLGKNILWQVGVLRLVALGRWDAVCLVGNPRVCSTWLVAALLRLRGIPVVFMTHGFYGTETGIRALFKKRFLQLASHVLVYSDAGRQIMISRGFSPDRVSAMYNSMSFEEQDAIYRQLEVQQPAVSRFACRTPYVVFIGRLEADKRVDLLISVLAELRLRDREVSCVIIGDGPARAKLELQSVSEGVVDLLRFAGALYSEAEIGEILFDAVAVVCPARVGLVAVHSLTYGVPLVTHSDVRLHGPEAEILVDGVNSSLVAPESVTAFADAIELWRSSWPRSLDIRATCRQPVVTKYNPGVQLRILEETLTTWRAASRGA